MPPLAAKKLPKIGEKREKSGEKRKNREEKSKNREGFFFTLPLRSDRDGYSLNVKRVKWLLFKRVESVKTTLIE